LHRKFLVYNLVNRNLKIRYRKSFFGMLWTVLIPATQACVFYFVFTQVLKVKTPNYLLMLMSGLVPWTFFIASIMGGLECLVGNHSLLNKVQLPVQALVSAETVTTLVNLIFSLPILVVLLVFSDAPVGMGSLQYPVLLGFLYLMAYSLA